MTRRNPQFRPQSKTHGGQGHYGRLVGKVVDIITTDFGNPHARLVVNVDGQRYEADINVFSTRPTEQYPQGSDVQFAIRDEVVTSVPEQGINQADTLAYATLGLTQRDFTSVDENSLHDKLDALARSCDLVEIFGVLYQDPDGTRGIHDIHMNSGENGTVADASSHDGAVAFYSLPQAGENFQAHAQWVFIKFATQTL